MFSKLALVFLLLFSKIIPSSSKDLSFIFNGFKSANLSLDGVTKITSEGLLKLTNETRMQMGHAFYPNPVTFKTPPNDTVSSFSTTFVFAIRSEFQTLSGHGIVFVIAPSRGLPGAFPNHYLGLFNDSNDGNKANNVFAVELDTISSTGFADINDNHVGIDINSLKSETSLPAGYYARENGGFKNLTLISSQPKRVWVEYDAVKKQINVTLAPVNVVKPQKPLLSFTRDLSWIIKDAMYVGFSSSTGSVPTSHYILGWSFMVNGQAQELDLSQLPKLPRVGPKPKSKLLKIGLPAICLSLAALVISGLVYFIKMKRKFAELVEDWELEYGPHRYKYKDLYYATMGFKEKELLV